jgi:hypothetical protein
MARRLEGRDAVEVYVTQNGQIAIKQDSTMSDEVIVFLEPHDVPRIVKWLKECVADADEIRQMKDDEAVNEQVVPQ